MLPAGFAEAASCAVARCADAPPVHTLVWAITVAGVNAQMAKQEISDAQTARYMGTVYSHAAADFIFYPVSGEQFAGTTVVVSVEVVDVD